MSWLAVFQTLWPIAVTITPLVLWAGFIWLSTKFVTKEEGAKSAAEVDKLCEDVDQLDHRMTLTEGRVEAVEKSAIERPTRADLSKSMADLAERMSAVEVGTDAVSRQLATANNYLHTLIEQGIRK